MALRSLARGTWAPAACALRCPSGAGTPPAAAAAAAPSRFLSTVRKQVKQHSSGTQKEASDEKAFLLLKELDRVFEALRQREKDFEKLRGEMKRVLKIYGVSLTGITAYSVFWSWSHEKSTQPAAQGTSHE